MRVTRRRCSNRRSCNCLFPRDLLIHFSDLRRARCVKNIYRARQSQFFSRVSPFAREPFRWVGQTDVLCCTRAIVCTPIYGLNHHPAQASCTCTFTLLDHSFCNGDYCRLAIPNSRVRFRETKRVSHVRNTPVDDVIKSYSWRRQGWRDSPEEDSLYRRCFKFHFPPSLSLRILLASFIPTRKYRGSEERRAETRCGGTTEGRRKLESGKKQRERGASWQNREKTRLKETQTGAIHHAKPISTERRSRHLELRRGSMCGHTQTCGIRYARNTRF